MSEEVIENVELIETPEVLPEVNNDVVETQENHVEEEKPYKKHKIPDNIPYSRFKEVTAKKTEAETRAQELEMRLREKEQEISKFLEKQENIKKYGSVDDIKANLDKMSPEEMIESLASVMESKVSTHYEERRRAQEIEQRQTDIATKFTSRIEAARESIPDINDMVEYVSHHAQYFDPNLRAKIVTDEYSAEIIAELASSPDLLKQMIEMPTYESLALIGEIRAEIKASKKNQNTSLPKIEPVVKTPNIPNGRVANNTKRIPPGVSMSEYKRLRGLGYT